MITDSSAIETNSKEVSIDTKQNICTFSGNAEVIYDKNGKSNVLKADRITIYYNEKNLKSPKKIIADGKVFFTNDEFTVNSSSCEFDTKVIKFKENVKIKNKELGEIEADSATYNIDEKKIDIDSKKMVSVKVNQKTSEKIDKISKN